MSEWHARICSKYCCGPNKQQIRSVLLSASGSEAGGGSLSMFVSDNAVLAWRSPPNN